MSQGPLPLLLQQADRALALYQSQQPPVAQLQEVGGQSLRVELLDLGVSFALLVEGRITLTPATELPSFYSCSVKCKSTLLPQLKESALLPELIKSGALELEGDIQVASRIADALQQTHFDSEEWLSGYLGDVPAHLFCKGMTKLARWLSYRKEQTKADLVEWLQDEIRLLPMAAEQRLQSQSVTALTAQVEQVEQRVAALRMAVKGEL